MSRIIEEILKASINHQNERVARWQRECQLSEEQLHEKPL